jgi:hypothetical protein
MQLCDLLQLLSSSESERDMLSEVRQTREEEEGEEEGTKRRRMRMRVAGRGGESNGVERCANAGP